jgi:hypothetical protein
MRKFQTAVSKKIIIRDELGAEIAYAHNGTIFVTTDGRRVAILRSGEVYAMDGQRIGRLAPRGAVLREDGSLVEAFLRLVAG